MSPETGPPKTPSKMSEEELADALREQVNLARNGPKGHNRKLTHAIAAEAAKRGWGKLTP